MLARLAPTVLLTALTLTATALAAAPPVGPLPPGPTTQITTKRGEVVAIALPPQPNGRVWRLKGSIDTHIVREVSEANVGSTVVIIFKTTGRGTATLSYGSTRGETAKAFSARRFRITVS
jgi:hypothetical protein